MLRYVLYAAAIIFTVLTFGAIWNDLMPSKAVGSSLPGAPLAVIALFFWFLARTGR